MTEKEADNTKEGEKEKKKQEESASKEDNPVREEDKKKVAENKKSEWTRVGKKVKPEPRKELVRQRSCAILVAHHSLRLEETKAACTNTVCHQCPRRPCQ